MIKYRAFSGFLIATFILLGLFIYKSELATLKDNPRLAKYAFRLGLDLNGGTELTYRADVSKIKGDVDGAMNSLRDVIERRVNLFGVSEPIVQVEKSGIVSGSSEEKLSVSLPGVTDINQAVQLIGKTPQLDFRLLKPEAKNLTPEELNSRPIEDLFTYTGLDGRLLSNAKLQFTTANNAGQISGEPIVALTLNDEGRDLFAKITRENKGEILAIFLDGQIISSPVVRDEITDGKAIISGSFSPEEARNLVRDLNYGALPVPIELIGTQTVGASLGEDVKDAGVKAGIWGSLFIVVFLILWYRLPGLVASIALLGYVIISLVIFKLVPVTFTAAGIAGFILSIGMAVDANVLIFERMKEELRKGKDLGDSLHEGFSRAWLSIRDSNISSIITAVILFWVGTSSIKGFALTLGIGVLVSMFTAITVSRTFLFAIVPRNSQSKTAKFLFGSGFDF